MTLYGGIFDLEAKIKQIELLSKQQEDPATWTDRVLSQKIGKEKRSLEIIVSQAEYLNKHLKDNQELFDLASTEDDLETLKTIKEDTVELEKKVDDLYAKEHEFGEKVEKEDVFKEFDKIEKIDKKIGSLIKNYESHFNPHWGEVMRAGVEPSIYASQIERYACIYMDKVSDLNDFSPRTYYRPKKRKLAHEI